MHLAFVSALPDPPAFARLMDEYYAGIVAKLAAAGGPSLHPAALTAETLANIDAHFPPDGRILLAHDPDGRLVGCGALRRIRPDAAELKRMFVRPEARGTGLGRQLFERRLAEARRMCCRAVYADTVKGNVEMLRMYEKQGFRYIDRYPENANDPALAPYLVYLTLTLDPAA